MARDELWVAVLVWSPLTAHKLAARHQLDVVEVCDEIKHREGLDWEWNHHPERGWRVIVETSIRGRRVLVVLYPDHAGREDTWHLGSAYPIG